MVEGNLDTSKMKKVTVAWLAENVDSWRENALLTNLPRAYINVGTFEPVLHHVVSIIDPLPSWTVGANGLYTVWLANELDESLELEGDYVVWLDEIDVQPIEDWSADAPDWVDALEAAKETAPQHVTVSLPSDDIELSFEGDTLVLTVPAVEGFSWRDLFGACAGQRVTLRLSAVVGNFPTIDEAA